ncbi:MAG: hypothetical protein R3D81_16925 [Thalassovita sp.]
MTDRPSNTPPKVFHLFAPITDRAQFDATNAALDQARSFFFRHARPPAACWLH